MRQLHVACSHTVSEAQYEQYKVSVEERWKNEQMPLAKTALRKAGASDEEIAAAKITDEYTNDGCRTWCRVMRVLTTNPDGGDRR